ncbi:unnamed protein product, partial [Prorocentrum cordatum]
AYFNEKCCGGDGDCFFLTASHGIRANRSKPKQMAEKEMGPGGALQANLRMIVSASMTDNKRYPQDEARKAAKTGEWATSAMVRAAAVTTKTNFAIWKKSRTGTWTLYTAPADIKTKQVVWATLVDKHYKLLLPKAGVFWDYQLAMRLSMTLCLIMIYQHAALSATTIIFVTVGGSLMERMRPVTFYNKHEYTGERYTTWHQSLPEDVKPSVCQITEDNVETVKDGKQGNTVYSCTRCGRRKTLAKHILKKGNTAWAVCARRPGDPRKVKEATHDVWARIVNRDYADQIEAAHKKTQEKQRRRQRTPEMKAKRQEYFKRQKLMRMLRRPAAVAPGE